MATETCLLGFPDYIAETRNLAQRLELDCEQVQIHHFPDGESKLQLPTRLPGQVVICQTLDRPNQKLVELLFAAAAAREMGVKSIILVAPYLCYMRQDKAFRAGEVVSQRVIGGFLAEHFDAVVTVDAHLHRIDRLTQAIPLRQALNLSATEPMGRFLQETCQQPLLVGPDAESEQWVAAIAAHAGLDYCIAHKQRRGDMDVDVKLPEFEFAGRDIVLVDDVASTGHTLEKAAVELLRRAAASVSVLVTHALFVDDACSRLERAGVVNIWSCDSIPHPSNQLSLAPVLAQGLRQLLDAPGPKRVNAGEPGRAPS
jgi:ribose-phosphate pyrophosphokinase